MSSIGEFLKNAIATKVARWTTDASGNVTGLVGPDGQAISVFPDGFQSADNGTMVFVRDHAYPQIVGDGSHASMHQWFKDNLLYPYSLTINTVNDTQHGNGNSAAPGGSNAMSWAEVKSLQDDGVEITNHTARHIGSLRRANTGFVLKYAGANATATAYVAYTTGVDPVLHCVDSADNTFDLTHANYDTLAELKAGVEALAGWTMTLAPELDGSERSNLILGVAVGNARNCKTAAGARFAISGGLLIRYKGKYLKTAYARILNGAYLQIVGDGVVLSELSLSSGSYDTIAEIATLINTTAFGQDSAGDWECFYMDSDGGADSYASGTETSRYVLGGMPATAWVDVAGQYGYLPSGMPPQQVWRKLLGKAKADAAAYGITMRNFSDVGGPAPSGMMPALCEFNNLARTTYVENAIWPHALPVDMAFAITASGADDNTTSITTANLVACIQAIADSPGFVISPFLHQLDPDGSTGLSFLDVVSAGDGYQSETKVAAMLAAVFAEKSAGRLNTLTQQSFYAMRGVLSRPSNRIFNPKFINSGAALAGILSASNGAHIPGWSLNTPNATSFTVEDGVITAAFDTASSSNYISQIVYLTPGHIYEVGALIESLAYTSGSGVSVVIAPIATAGAQEYRNEADQNLGLWIKDYVTVKGKNPRALITVPPLGRKSNYIRNAYNAWDDDSAKTWDLSSVKHIKLNIDGKGVIEIDCSSGAGSAAAVYAYEIAAAINAAIKASATYKAYGEYHNIARAENGYLIIEGHYPSFQTTDSIAFVVTAGTTTDATNKIFGGQSGVDRPMGFSVPGGGQGMIHPYKIEIIFNAVGTFRVSGVHVVEVESMQ